MTATIESGTLPYDTIAEAIVGTAERWPANGFTFQDVKGREVLFSFPEIVKETARRAGALQALGLRKGDRLAMAVIEPQDFVLTFLAALRVGIVPVPVYPPLGLSDATAYNIRIGRILQSCEARMLFASRRLESLLWPQASELSTMRQRLLKGCSSLERIITVRHLEGGAVPNYPSIAPDDLALLQYTSGSTDEPKGVMVTHRCLVANGTALSGPFILQVDPRRDRAVSWLPLYHDMGLISFVIGPLCCGVSVVFIPTVRFLRTPHVWMDTIHRHRGTISCGPSFAYSLMTRQATAARLAQWDLSCLRFLGCGGEPINPEIISAFSRLFSHHTGLPPNAVKPSYGCAEGTMCASMTTMDEGLHLNIVDAQEFRERGVAAPPVDGRPTLEHVACGVRLPNVEIVAMDAEGQPHPDGVEGEIFLRGPSVSPGYFGNDAATRAAFHDGWFRTGDLGYVLDGRIYITGRIKDLIIYHGRSYHPQSLEWPVGNLAAVRHVVAFSIPGDESERLVIALETTSPDREALIADVKRVVQAEMGLTPHDVVLLGKHGLPRTSSGKLQRRKTRELYLGGELGQPGARFRLGELTRRFLRSLLPGCVREVRP